MRCGVKASRNTARRRKASSAWRNVPNSSKPSASVYAASLTTDNLAEEMADVIICLYLLKEMYDITDEQLNEWIARKTARQSKRMQADDPFLEGKDAE